MSKEPLTEERIAEIRGREKVATQGPWGNMLALVISGEKDIAVAQYSRGVTRDEQRANAAFIAHAREDIPTLLDEVERLRAENERQKEVISFLGDAAKGLVFDEVERRKCEQ